MMRLLLLGLLGSLLVPATAAAADGWTLTAGLSNVRSDPWFPSAGSLRTTLQLTVLRRSLGLSFGVACLHNRVLNGLTAFEGFTQARYTAAIGEAWRPAVGLELGATGSQRYASEVEEWTVLRRSPVYLTTFAEPLRFRLGPVHLSALEVGFGSHLRNYGRVLRIRLTYLRVGVWPRGS